MEKEDIAFLNQLVKSLEATEPKLEKAYKEKNAAKFNALKKFMLDIHQQISGILR